MNHAVASMFEQILYVQVVSVFTAPSSPVNVTAVALSAKEIKVTWKHPSETRGKLKNFKLQVIITSSGLKKEATYNKIKLKGVTHDEKSYTSKVSTFYFIYVLIFQCSYVGTKVKEVINSVI